MAVRNGTSTNTNTTKFYNENKQNCGQAADELVYLHVKFNIGLFDGRMVYFC
jgi:hypothetical protein